jgi:hypothetical protein
MKKNFHILIVLVALVVLVITLIIYNKAMTEPKSGESTIHFVNTKVFISGSVGEKITFPVVFFMDKKYESKDIIDDISLIDSTGAEISDWQLLDGKAYKDSKLNNISIAIKLTKEGQSSLGGLQIRLKDGTNKEYKFDDWMIDVMGHSPGNFTIATQDADVASGNKAFFDVKTKSDSIITIRDLDLISDKVKLKNGTFKVNGKTYDSLNGIQLSKSDVLDLNFETEISGKCGLYFIRPSIDYTLDGKAYKEPITYGTVYGLQYDDTKIAEMYKAYVEKSK